MNAGNTNMSWMISSERIRKLGIHASETAWVGGEIDHTVINDSSIDDLFTQIRNLLPSELSVETQIVLDLI
jgi:hypothetical protein